LIFTSIEKITNNTEQCRRPRRHKTKITIRCESDYVTVWNQKFKMLD